MNGSCYAANPALAATALPASRRRTTGTMVQLLERFLAWHDRARSRRVLLGMDDRMLQDIGVDRAAAQVEGSRPFWK